MVVCNCCGEPPDEDGFYRDLCYSCFVVHEEHKEQSSTSSSDDESDEANDILMGGAHACGAAPDENGLCRGLCYNCFLQQNTRIDYSVMEESDVSHVIVVNIV